MPVRVVLVEPSHPGNIGAVARALGNMGFSRLSLVRPTEYLIEEARVRSANNEEILFNASVYSSLEDAVAQCTFVVGTSARPRTISWPSQPPRQAMAQLAGFDDRGEEVAILFGPENSGLSNQQLDLCDIHVRIPTSEKSPSINLAGAVLLLLYELRIAKNAIASDVSEGITRDDSEQMANRFQIEGFFRHLRQVMVEVDFISDQPREKLMRKIRRIFLRPGLTVEEVNILRGILTEVMKTVAKVNPKRE